MVTSKNVAKKPEPVSELARAESKLNAVRKRHADITEQIHENRHAYENLDMQTEHAIAALLRKTAEQKENLSRTRTLLYRDQAAIAEEVQSATKAFDKAVSSVSHDAPQ